MVFIISLILEMLFPGERIPEPSKYSLQVLHSSLVWKFLRINVTTTTDPSLKSFEILNFFAPLKQELNNVTMNDRKTIIFLDFNGSFDEFRLSLYFQLHQLNKYRHLTKKIHQKQIFFSGKRSCELPLTSL